MPTSDGELRGAASPIAPRFPEEILEKRLRAAPTRYLLTLSPDSVARHLRMIEVRPRRGEVRLEAEPKSEEGHWTVHVAMLDGKGVLASITGALASHGVSVREAWIFTWSNRIAIDVFRVQADRRIDWNAVRRSMEYLLRHPSDWSRATVTGRIDVEGKAFPGRTMLRIQARDREGLLHQVAATLARTRLQVHEAVITTPGSHAVDTFWVTRRNGRPLRDADEEALRDAFSGRRSRRRAAGRRSGEGAGRRG
jgi:[protein-PII] uridylyltransferase